MSADELLQELGQIVATMLQAVGVERRHGMRAEALVDACAAYPHDTPLQQTLWRRLDDVTLRVEQARIDNIAARLECVITQSISM